MLFKRFSFHWPRWACYLLWCCQIDMTVHHNEVHHRNEWRMALTAGDDTLKESNRIRWIEREGYDDGTTIGRPWEGCESHKVRSVAINQSNKRFRYVDALHEQTYCSNMINDSQASIFRYGGHVWENTKSGSMQHHLSVAFLSKIWAPYQWPFNVRLANEAHRILSWHLSLPHLIGSVAEARLG